MDFKIAPNNYKSIRSGRVSREDAGSSWKRDSVQLTYKTLICAASICKVQHIFSIRSGRSVWRKTPDCLMWTWWILKVSRVWDLQKQMDRQADKNRASISGHGRWRMSRVPHMPAWALLNQQHVNAENRQAAAGFYQPTEALWTQPVRHPHMHAHTLNTHTKYAHVQYINTHIH